MIDIIFQKYYAFKMEGKLVQLCYRCQMGYRNRLVKFKSNDKSLRTKNDSERKRSVILFE